MPREGVLVYKVYERLDRDQLRRLHGTVVKKALVNSEISSRFH